MQKRKFLTSLKERKLTSQRDKKFTSLSVSEKSLFLKRKKYFEKKYDFKTNDVKYFFEVFKNIKEIKNKTKISTESIFSFLKEINKPEIIKNNFFLLSICKRTFSLNPLKEITYIPIVEFFSNYFKSSSVNKLNFSSELKLTSLILLKSFSLNTEQLGLFKEHLNFLYNTNVKVNSNGDLIFNNIFLSKIYKDLDRIKAGLISSKLYSFKSERYCQKTYGGFLNVLKSNSAFLIKINGRNYIAKSKVGQGIDSGINRLLLDPKTLDVFSFIVINGKIKITSSPLISYDNILQGPTLNKEIKNYLERLKDNYTKYYENRYFSTKEKKEKALKRVLDIFLNEKINNFAPLKF